MIRGIYLYVYKAGNEIGSLCVLKNKMFMYFKITARQIITPIKVA